mgnify:FL=1
MVRAAFLNPEFPTLIFTIYTNIFRTAPTFPRISGIDPADFAGVGDEIEMPPQVFIRGELWVIVSSSIE